MGVVCLVAATVTSCEESESGSQTAVTTGAPTTPLTSPTEPPTTALATTTTSSTTTTTRPPETTSTTPERQPTSEWRLSTPEAEGVDSQQLVAVFDEIADSNYRIDSVTIVRHGAMILDTYLRLHLPHTLHNTHSCTKSIVSTLIGITIDKGLIAGVEVPLLDLFPGVAVDDLDAAKQSITLEHALTMTTGMDSQESTDDWTGTRLMMASDEQAEYALSFPMVAEPGTHFAYSSTASHLLSEALQRATGMTTAEFAEEHLFGPLGITDYRWPASPEGVNYGFSGLRLKPQDMAKVGYLMLHHGSWDGRQVVPAQWVADATMAHIPVEDYFSYGYQWWIDPTGFFFALGWGGQYIVVLPDHDAVVVFTGGLSGLDELFVPYDLLTRLIIPAMESAGPLPANPEGLAALDAAITRAGGR